tara:strand:- start:2591 stop:2830 length:240 start_codon:yes stop_codon:yes gene_type:complete
MKVVVTTVDFPHAYPPKGVRKCPPNYKPKDNEWVIELDDYTEEDIKEYFEKPQIWGRRHEDPEKEEYIRSNTSLMHNNT